MNNGICLTKSKGKVTCYFLVYILTDFSRLNKTKFKLNSCASPFKESLDHERFLRQPLHVKTRPMCGIKTNSGSPFSRRYLVLFAGIIL